MVSLVTNVFQNPAQTSEIAIDETRIDIVELAAIGDERMAARRKRRRIDLGCQIRDFYARLLGDKWHTKL